MVNGRNHNRKDSGHRTAKPPQVLIGMSAISYERFRPAQYCLHCSRYTAAPQATARTPPCSRPIENKPLVAGGMVLAHDGKTRFYAAVEAAKA